MKGVSTWMGRVCGAMFLAAAFSSAAHADRSWYGYTTTVASGKGAEGWPNTATCTDKVTGAMTGAIGGTCHSRYCWAMTLYHYPLPAGASFDASTTRWSQPFSEEGRNWHVCNNDGSLPGGWGIVTGIKVSGNYSDNIQLQCTQLQQGIVVDPCYWSPWISDGAPLPQYQLDLRDDQFVAGMACRGDYCDDVSFLYCTVVP